MELGNRDPFGLAIGITVLILLAISNGILIHSLIERCYGARNQSTAYSEEMPESYDTNSVLQMDMPPKYEDIELQSSSNETIYADLLFVDQPVRQL